MDNLDQLQLKIDKILNPSMPEPVAITTVKPPQIDPLIRAIAPGMGNNLGAATMSPIEKDLRTLTDNELYAKYGQQQADEMLGQLALATGDLQRKNLSERNWGETALDSTLGASNAFVGGLGSILAWGAGKVNDKAGVLGSEAVESLRRITEENQSDALNQHRQVLAAKDALAQRDSDAQYELDIKNGDSKTVAGLAQIGRDITNSSVFDDSMLVGQGTADAIGSFLTAGPIAGVIRGAAKAVIPKATTRGIGLSGAMDKELGNWTAARVLSNADKAVWPLAIGTLESGGTYQQTVEDATNTLKQQGQTVGDKLELINDTAQQAADRMFLPAAALGTITRFGEKPFHVPSLRQGATNVLGRELPEEAGQGAVGTILSNQAIQDKIDPNRKTGEGVAKATVEGAVYGSFAAGTVQAPGLAKQSVISAAKATLGYVDKRTALAAEKADDASPVGTKALKEKASTLVPNAEPVKQSVAAELDSTNLTPEQKQEGSAYANALVDSLNINGLPNKFGELTPETVNVITGSEHRIDAIQKLAKQMGQQTDPNLKLNTASAMYELLQPIIDLQTNRPEAIDNLSPESQAVLKGYETLLANVNNSVPVRNALKQVHEILIQHGAEMLSPVLDTELNTPAGKQKVQSIITAATIAPDQGNLDATESILKHAKEGKLNLTPEQTTTLNASVALLRARKELEEKNKQFGLNATDIVSSEILTDKGVKDDNARSATQYTQEILSAVRRGNALGATQLLYDMGLFVKHMRNKVEAINKHYLNGNPKAAPVPYEALLPTTHQWVDSATNPKAIHKGGFVNTLNPGSIKFVQGVELEHKILADVYNSLTEVFPDLGIDRIEPLQLEKGISGAIRRTTQEPTKPVVKEEEEINYELLVKKPIDDLTLNEWSVIFGNIQGKVNTDGANDSIGIDDVILLNKLVKKIITDGVNKQQSRESIISRIDQTTKGGISTTAMQRIHALLDNNLKEKPEIKVVEPKVEDKPIQKEQVNEPIVETKVKEKPESVKQDKATITKEEVSKLSIKELNSKINATFNRADIVILNNELISREVVLEGYDQPVLEDIEPPKKFELNDGQKKAFDKIMSFLDGSGITFTLTGSAGTGKTTLVNTIIAALKKAKSEYGSVVLSAPTHRANAVTKSKNKDQKVMTLHQLLSLAPEVDLENFDASKVKFNQIEKEKDPFPKSGLIIIDESSMISDALYNFLMDKVSEFPDVKILFLGDAAQLRPVTKDNKSSLQDSKALTQTDGQANLTKVERAKNPELLDESINLREKGSFTNNNNMKNSNGVAFTNSEAGFINRLIRMFKSQEFADNRLLVRAVAYTNKRVTEINSKVRESLYGKDAPDYVVGDLLMGYNRFGKQDDKGNLPIANGIDYLVTSVGSEKTIDILGVQVKTANITIKDVYGLGGSNTLTVILPSNDASVWQSLGEKFQKLSTQAYAAKDKSIFDNEADKYVFPRDLKALVTPRNTSIKPFETTLIKQTINYGYAHTIHKSQGGTYTYVFVDEPSILSTKDLDTRKRLRYVGMTRAEKGAYILTTSEITGEPITEAKFPVATSVTDLKDAPVKQEPIPVEPVVTKEVPIKQEQPAVTAEAVESTNKVDPKTFTNHSGGAYGADTAWDTIGREFGVTNHNHYRDEKNSNLSAKLKAAGVKAVTLTAAALNKARDTVNKLLGTNHKDDIAGNLQARNYYQVANSDGVFAIGSLTSNKKGVTGGTNTAIQLAIKLTDKVRPVYVWDTNTQRWYEFNRTKGVFQATTTPTLTKEFAGIGTRDIENYNTKNQLTGKFEPRKQYVGDEIANAAKQAIKDVYAKTLLGIAPVNEELDNELPVEDTIIDNSPIVTGNKNAVIKVKADVVAPSKFSNLVQGVKNFFLNSFKFKGDETTRTDSVESPLDFVKKTLLDSSSFQEVVPNSKYEMNKTVAQAYRGYLGQYYDELTNKLTDNLKLFFSEKKRLARFEKGDPLNRFEEGKVLNIIERTDKGYEYNQHLLELATLAGLQWFLTAGQTERRVDIEDVAQLLGITEDKITDELMNQFLNTSDMGQLSQGLTNTIKSFWGISGISTEMMAYTDGIPEAMAAEIIRAFTEMKVPLVTLTKVDHPTKPGQEVNRFEVNRFDNDALYSFPTAIQEVVLIESEDVTYFGDDIPPVPQTQLGSPTIKLSRKEKKAVAAANKTGVKTNVLQANVIMSLSQDALKVMFGGGIENEHMNKNTLASIQGENKTILNAYQAMVDMLSRVDNVSKTLGKDASEVVMRFPHTITKVGRLMMLGKYNIQSSKLLREVFLPTWSTLDLQNNQDHIDAFHLAVSQALGIKVHNEGPESFNKLIVLLSGKLAPAITLVQDWMEATDNGENPIAFDGIKLAQIFKDAKEGLTPNAFHALIEYVRYQRTEDKTKFTTGLYLEADGVTNGPGNAIQMLTLGRFTGNWVTTVEKIGHSFREPKAKHELDKNNKDLYGTAGVASVAPLQAIISKIRQSPDKNEIMGTLGSLYSLMGTTVEGIKYDPSKLWTTGGVDTNRNFFKNPLTILLYGSGIRGIAGKAAKQMTDNIYKLFSDANVLLNSNDGIKRTQAEAMFPKSENPQEAYDKFMNDLSTIMNTTIEYNGKSKQYFLNDVTHSKRSAKDLKLENFTFSGSEIDAITQNITKGLVDAMYEGAVQTVGKSVMDSTKLIQQATQIQSILLEAAFTKAVRDKIKNYKSLDPEYRAGDFISKQDFMDIMEELKAIAPYLKTDDQTFLAAKSKRYRNETDSKVEYSRSLNDMFRTEPNMYIPTNAGVSGTPNLVIGMGDAYAILQAAIDESLVGNLWIYDGINMPLDKIKEYAPKLNDAAFQAWQNNPLRVIEEAFRTFMAAESMMTKALSETLSNKDLADQLNKSLKLYKEEDKLSTTEDALTLFGDLLNQLKNSADSIDARHAAIARMPNSVDQLAAAGVPYHNGITVDPTLDTPEKIAAQLNKYYQEELDKINNKPKAEPAKQMTPEEMDPITKDMLNNAYHHSSGVKILNAEGLANLGRSINLSREQKIGFLQIIRAKTLDGYAVIFGSVDQIKEYRKQSKYSDISLDQETDNGFIDLKTKTIYLINPSVETLVHEMIHAATYGSVLNYYQNPSLNTKEVNEAIERTEGLMGEFLKLSPKELARLTPEARAAINNVKAAIQEPGNDLDNTSDVALAKSLNEFMAWSLSNQELISTFRKVEMPAYLRIAKEVIDLIKKFFTFKDKATGETKEQDLKIPKDLFGNLLFNASIIINNAQPSLAETMADTTLFHSGTAKHITQLRETLIDKVALFLDKSGQAFNVALYNSGFARVLTEAADTVNSLVPIFGLSSIEQSTLHHVVAALSAEIQVDPLTIDGIQTLYAHTVVELAKQVDAGTYPKAKYDALIGRIGNPKIINGKSTLLPVFLGLGLIDTELRDALAKIDMPTKTKNTTGTLNGGLENQANKMLDGLFKVLTGQRKAHDVSDALELLTERLTEIALKEDSAAKSVFNKPGISTDKANEWITDNIAVVADKGIALGKKLETSQYLAVKRLGSAITVLSMMATDKNGETVARGAIAMANKGNTWKPFRSIVGDFIGLSESNAGPYNLIKKVRAAVQQMRQTFKDKVPKIIAQKFTRTLSKNEWATLFRSMAKTDLSSLMDILSKKEIMEIFSNPSSLNKHISMLETRIQNQDKTNWSLYQAKMKQLARFMNTGVTGSNLLRNPYAIHSLLNETKPKGFQTMGRDTIHDIDQLTTLYAIRSLSQEDKAIMSDMVNEQSEGLEFIIDYLVGQNVTEITKLSTNPAVQMNYYKGHIPQINQSGASLIVAEDVNRADLLLQGYTRVGDYFGSNLDTNRLDKGYYFTDVSAKGSVAQGTIQNIQRTILGVDDFYGFTVGSNDRITDPIVVANITKRISRENVGIENLMPVFNDKGAVIAYERSMTPEKLAMLKPSEHLAEMIGVWRGRQLEEQLAQEINEEVIDKHYDMYLKDIANSPSSQKEYVDVLDKKQLDVVEQDMVSLFSIDTIRYMANKNNGKFYVRKDVLDDMIGYRKASVSDIFTGKTRMNKPLQDAIRKVLISTFGVSAYRKAVKTERFLQNVVGEARTLIVVKSLVVPMFNIVSNIVQLVARGVPIATIVKSSPTKLLELRSYTMSQVKQVELEAEHRAASGDLRRQQVLESQIQAIKDGHKRLSIWPLIEAGEFSTISDIGNNSEDIDLFSGNTESWLDKQVSKLPANAQTVAKYGMVARDTALFQGLQKMVQYGDFIAKAVMYDDLLKRKGLTKEQALGKITDEFVNYDKLPGRARGYLEDTGLLWFYNYKLRITKIALSMIRNNPLHLLLAHAAPIPLGAGIATEDNFITKLFDGSLTRSIGPGMVVGAPLLNPWYNAMN